MAGTQTWQTVINTAAIALTAQGVVLVADTVPANDVLGVVLVVLGAALEFVKYSLVEYWSHK